MRRTPPHDGRAGRQFRLHYYRRRIGRLHAGEQALGRIDLRVLLLEAGGWDRHPFVKLPLGWGKVLLSRIYDWGYDGEPQDTMGGRRIECARGKVVGGSSTINAMAYVRGNRGDYARWTSYGLQGGRMPTCCPTFAARKAGRAARPPIAAVTDRWPRANRATGTR